MVKSKNILGAVALTKARDLQDLIDTLNNTTTVNLLSDINYIENIDNAVLESNSKSLPLIILLSAMRNDIDLIQNIDFDTIFSLAANIDGLIAAIESAKNISQQNADITLQAKDDTVTAIENASLYDPTRQERRYKAQFFGIKLL